MARRARSERGFTLIELMIVCACIGVLASIAIPSYTGLKARAVRTEMVNQMEQVAHDATHFFRLHGQFPPMGTYSCGISLPAPVNSGSTVPISGPFNPCAALGGDAPMEWGDGPAYRSNPDGANPWHALGQQVNAAVSFSRVRYIAETSRSGQPPGQADLFNLCAVHDFDADGRTGQTCITLVSSGGADPFRIDTGWDDVN